MPTTKCCLLATAVAAVLLSPLMSLAQSVQGDYNGDGLVSQGDLDLVLLNWGSPTLPIGFVQNNLIAGGPFDGLIAQDELDGVLINWGDGPGGPPPYPAFDNGEVAVVPVDISSQLPGFVAVDFEITFTGQYTGSQLLVELTAGSIYQDPNDLDNARTSTAPLAIDTFVAQGQIPATSMSTLAFNGAVDLGGQVSSDVDGTTGFDGAWFPSAGLNITNQSDFATARLILSDDAQGTLSYIAFVNGQAIVLNSEIVDGQIGVIPEPTTTLLAIFAIGILASRARRS